jgi:hypothetical protein
MVPHPYVSTNPETQLMDTLMGTPHVSLRRLGANPSSCLFAFELKRLEMKGN